MGSRLSYAYLSANPSLKGDWSALPGPGWCFLWGAVRLSRFSRRLTLPPGRNYSSAMVRRGDSPPRAGIRRVAEKGNLSLLIAILLLKYLKVRSRYSWSLSNLVALLRLNLFSYRDLWEWIDNPTEPPPVVLEQEQPALSFA